LILIILNPTYTNFKEYTGISGHQSKFLHKTNDYVILSVYLNELNNKKYLGIIKNFFDITPEYKLPPNFAIPADSVTAVSDSAKVVYDSVAVANLLDSINK
jgi:hypothetical protein